MPPLTTDTKRVLMEALRGRRRSLIVMEHDALTRGQKVDASVLRDLTVVELLLLSYGQQAVEDD